MDLNQQKHAMLIPKCNIFKTFIIQNLDFLNDFCIFKKLFLLCYLHLEHTHLLWFIKSLHLKHFLHLHIYRTLLLRKQS